MQYARSLLFDGLPGEWVDRLQDVMRLSASSMRTLEAGMRIWRIVANKYGWEPIIVTDDLRRAAKLATLVLYMLDETTLAYGSISLYLWGVRQHMVLHRQADPIYGVPSWREFMSSIQVLAHAQAEPRRELPLDVTQLILELPMTRALWMLTSHSSLSFCSSHSRARKHHVRKLLQASILLSTGNARTSSGGAWTRCTVWQCGSKQ